jgi:hypothetical protein
VVAPVVLNYQSRRGVVEVRPTDESIVEVIEVRLDLWAREAALDRKPTKPGLHLRFGGRRKRCDGPKLSPTVDQVPRIDNPPRLGAPQRWLDSAPFAQLGRLRAKIPPLLIERGEIKRGKTEPD